MDLLSLALGGTCVVSGTAMAIFSEQKHAAKLARKAELSAGASERFYEERRAVDAYPSPKTKIGWRIRGIALAVLGIIIIGMAIYR
jgi:hypothetical protein